jgi:hypothetical protein
MLVTLGGVLLLTGGFVWLLFRLGGFHLTARERRTWAILGALLLAWIVFLAFVGPLPPLMSVLLSVGAFAFAIWSWRGGQFSLDKVPADSREEVARRREWMRAHRGLSIGLCLGFAVLVCVWAVAIALVTLPA